MTSATAIRRQIRARAGWQTRRRARIETLERQLRRLRRSDRRREVQRQIAALRRQIADGERQLRQLRRQLAELRRQEPVPEPEPAAEPAPPPPPPEPEPAPPPTPPPPPAPPTYEQRWQNLGGGVAPLADGRRRGFVRVDPRYVPWDEPPTLDEWVEVVEWAVGELAPHPDQPDPTWRGRLWIAVSRVEEDQPGATPQTRGDDYETDGPDPGASLIRKGKGTYSGWTPRPERLALIADVVLTALAAHDWLIEEVWIEAVWGGAGYLPKKDLR